MQEFSHLINSKSKWIIFDAQVKTALFNMLFILPQLTPRVKTVTRTFVPIGQRHKETNGQTSAASLFVKVTEE